MSDTDSDRSNAQPFPALLREQIGAGFTAAQQYLAAGVYFDSGRLPQLAKRCYASSGAKRADALRMVQYLLDRDLEVRIESSGAVRPSFDSPRAAIAFLVDLERTSSAEVTALAHAARTSGDYLGERFTQWFLKEQVAEVAAMTTLLAVIDRATDDLFDVEEFIARELRAAAPVDMTAPKMAGASVI